MHSTDFNSTLVAILQLGRPIGFAQVQWRSQSPQAARMEAPHRRLAEIDGNRVKLDVWDLSVPEKYEK